MIKKINLQIILLFSFLLLPQFIVIADNNSLRSLEITNKTREISKNIRCLVCQNQSIDDSSSLLAKDLRVLIKQKVTNGFTDKEIYDYLSKRYGDYILFNPPLKTNTILLWFLPFVILIFGLFLIMNILKTNRFK